MEITKQGDVEILVHTTAPSRGVDDARYRAQAQAYLDFEHATKQSLHRDADESANYSQPRLSSQPSVEVTLSTQEERESRASYRPSDEDVDHRNSASMASFQSTILEETVERSQFLDSPELSFNSVLDNIGSPAFRGGVTRPTVRPREPTAQVFLTSPREQSRSFISDSQSDQQNNNPAISPAGVLEQYMQKLRQSESRVLHHGHIENPFSSQGSRGVNLSNRDAAIGSLTSSSELPSSPSPDRANTVNRNLYPITVTRNTTSAHDFATTSTSTKSPGKHSPFSSAPLEPSGILLPPLPPVSWPPNRQQTAPPATSLVPSSNLETLFNINRNRMTIEAITTSTSTPDPVSTKWDAVHEIRPNPPPTSTNDLIPSMLITPELQKLAARMNLALRFRPISQSRELRPMERGYWDIDCKTLSPELRRKCWSYLGDFISRDLAGWGVWAVRIMRESQSRIQGQGKGEASIPDPYLDPNKRQDEHMKIRVYCWGIITGHIYLLLYLASEGKIKGAGACWRGGDGNVIIEMPGS